MSREVLKLSLLYTTVGSLDVAEQLAERAVTEKQAACVNLFPNLHSVYGWEGKVERAVECGMLFKTAEGQLATLELWVLKNHPYKVPAILKFEANTSLPFANYISETLNEAE